MSTSKKKFIQYSYAWGASVVIVGALFKILHLPGGNWVIGIGLGVEALLFFISAFEDDADVLNVKDQNMGERIEEMFQKAKIDQKLINNFSDSINSFADSSKKLGKLSIGLVGENLEQYVGEIRKSVELTQNLNQIYESQLSSMNIQEKFRNDIQASFSKVLEETSVLKDEIKQFKENVTLLNNTYKGVINAMSINPNKN